MVGAVSSSETSVSGHSVSEESHLFQLCFFVSPVSTAAICCVVKCLRLIVFVTEYFRIAVLDFLFSSYTVRGISLLVSKMSLYFNISMI
jgi:hypothetical protein